MRQDSSTECLKTFGQVLRAIAFVLSAGSLACGPATGQFLSPEPFGPASQLKGSRPGASANPNSGVQQTQDRNSAGGSQQGSSAARPAEHVEKHGEWSLRCVAAPSLRCELGQRTQHNQTQTPQLWIEIARDRSQKLGALTVATPLGVDLRSGIRVMSDNTEIMRANFLGCIAIGCLSRPELTQRFLDRLSQAQFLQIIVMSIEGKPTTLLMPAAGFAEGYIRMAAILRQGKP